MEISSARIEEIINIIFNKNKNLYDLKDKEVDLYFDFEDKNIFNKFHYIFKNNLKKCKFNILKPKEEDPLESPLKYLVNFYLKGGLKKQYLS